MALNDAVSSAGKRASSSTRLRRRPTILSTCSMSTGHASTHAPQVTQSQTASYGMAVSTIGRSSAAVGRRRDRRLDPRDQRHARLRLDRHLADAHDHRLGVERLARGPRGARVLAAAALGAREAVEQVLPRQVLDRLDAEAGVLGLEVHGRQLAARLHLAERGVEERRHDVEVLGARQVDQEEADQQDVGPEEEGVAGLQRRRRQQVARGRCRAGSAANAQAASGSPYAAKPECLGQQLGQHHAADQQQDRSGRRATASAGAGSARRAAGTALSRPPPSTLRTKQVLAEEQEAPQPAVERPTRRPRGPARR